MKLVRLWVDEGGELKLVHRNGWPLHLLMLSYKNCLRGIAATGFGCCQFLLTTLDIPLEALQPTVF